MFPRRCKRHIDCNLYRGDGKSADVSVCYFRPGSERTRVSATEWVSLAFLPPRHRIPTFANIRGYWCTESIEQGDPIRFFPRPESDARSLPIWRPPKLCCFFTPSVHSPDLTGFIISRRWMTSARSHLRGGLGSYSSVTVTRAGGGMKSCRRHLCMWPIVNGCPIFVFSRMERQSYNLSYVCVCGLC